MLSCWTSEQVCQTWSRRVLCRNSLQSCNVCRFAQQKWWKWLKNKCRCHPEQRGERIINASGHKEIVRVIGHLLFTCQTQFWHSADDAKVSGHVVLQAIIAVQNLSFQNEYAQRQLTVSGAIGALITRLKITFKVVCRLDVLQRLISNQEGLSSVCDESCTRTSEFVVTAMRNLLVNNVDGKVRRL